MCAEKQKKYLKNNTYKTCINILVFFISIKSLIAQNSNWNQDSSIDKVKNLDDITIIGKNSKSDYQKMPEIVGTSIYAGKKTALILVDKVQGNIVNNTMRQILSKVPGIHVWESDPSGIQIGVAARGLSPNRSWEFNVRQNGYDIAADPYGYPEAYYNPQMQGVQKIEIVRGQGALQYGPQFGGLIHYILKNGSEIDKPFRIESEQTIGSNGLFNSYNAIGGKTKKLHYYTYFDHRNGKGWRDNSKFYTNAIFNTISYSFNKRWSITGELMTFHSLSQQPGGLTDSLFEANPKLSLRNRNWFDIKWMTPALILNYNMNATTRWNTKLFGTIGDRNSVGFTSAITINDTINLLTQNYNNRTLSADEYRNWGMESRLITDYQLGKTKNTFSGGIRFFSGNTIRNANGNGTNGNNYNMIALTEFPQSLAFTSNNIAFFVENIFRLKKNLLIIPGFRYEYIKGAVSGRNSFNSNGSELTVQNISRKRSFVLGGIGIEYDFKNNTEIYSNLSQAYRPIQFSNLQAAPTTDSIDENLSDAKGYNFDIGYRGKIKNYIQFDFSLYLLNYINRIGILSSSGSNNRLITNVGSSISKGIESYFEISPLKFLTPQYQFDFALFTSYSYTDANYSGTYKEDAIKNKRVENAPKHILRTGITLNYKWALLTTQYSFVDETFSDANNTIAPTKNGQSGLIPSYQIWDLSLSIKVRKKFELKSGINNVLNKNYFTRRAGGYPGPGLLPADGRTFYVSLGAKFQ
jgi:Fe(3+) dicitrate transport protein